MDTGQDIATLVSAKSAARTAGREIRWPWAGFLPRSYLFSLEPVAREPAGLRRIPLPSGHLFVSPDYQSHVEIQGRALLILIGYCFDLRRPAGSEADIMRSLLRCATQHGVNAMLAQTDELYGRFAAICHLEGRWHAFGDACATRTIYFSEDRAAIASHSTILGDLAGARPRTELFRHYWCALPGNASPVAGVRVLPANFVLDLASRRMRRFWPRCERKERRVPDVSDEVDELLERTAQVTAARWRPALSLTAGLDSRVSLSIYADVPTLVTFTYHRHREDTVDLEVAQRLSERLGIQHRRLLPVERHRAPRVYDLIESMPDCTFDRNVAPIFLSAFGGTEAPVIHIRSSLAEVGRAFWRRHPGMPTRFDAANWVQVSMAKSTAGLAGRAEAAAYMTREMRHFFNALGYDALEPRAPELFGYDAWDLVYMEHRMSTWHAQALLGSDMTFDTAMPFNSRRVLDLLMSVPLPDRREGRIFRAILARRSPHLADVPINPRARRTLRQLAAGAYRQIKRRSGLLRSMDARLRRAAR